MKWWHPAARSVKTASNGTSIFPSALAQAMEFEKGEEVEWIVADKAHLILSRQHAPPNAVRVKKTTRS
jgi:hypothetical protein